VASLRAGRGQAGVEHTLRGKTLGVYGYGRIGAVVAGFGRACGLDVLAWSRPESLERARADGVTPAGSATELCSACDVVSLHLRLVPATRGIVGAG